jgi:hypothetical protein
MPSRMPASKMSTSAKVTAATTASMLRGSRRYQSKRKTQKKGSHKGKEARHSEGRCSTHGLHRREESSPFYAARPERFADSKNPTVKNPLT